MTESTAIIVDQKNWADEILDLYRAGDFDVEVASHMEIPMAEFYRQMEEHGGFKRLVEYGRTLCQSFWIGQAKKNLNNKSFNPTVWQFVMKNQFGWADRTEQVGTVDMPQGNLDELRNQIERQLNDFLKKSRPELDTIEKNLKLVI